MMMNTMIILSSIYNLFYKLKIIYVNRLIIFIVTFSIYCH